MDKTRRGLTRRHFLRGAAVGGAAVAVQAAGLPARAFQGPSVALPMPAAGRVSKAIVNNLGSELARVYNRMRSGGAVTAEDVSTAASGLRLLFDHLAEIELTPEFEQEVVARSQELVYSQPSDAVLDGVRQEMARYGVSLTLEELRERFSRSTVSDKQWALDQIRQTGIQVMVDRAVADLKRLEEDLRLRERPAEPDVPPRPIPREWLLEPMRGRLPEWGPTAVREVQFLPEVRTIQFGGDSCTFWRAQLFIFEAWAGGAGLACLGIFVFCVIAAIMALLIAILEFVYWWYCE